MAHFDITDENRDEVIARLQGWARTAPRHVRVAGRAWYEEAYAVADGVAGLLRITIDQAAGVLAAISPQMDASENFKHDVVDIISGKRRRVPQRQLDKVNAILRGADPEDALPRCTSPKTNSFYRNILGDRSVVTIDGRMADMITDKMLAWEANRGIANACNKRGGLTRYEQYEQLVIDAAKPLRWSGFQLQAVLWLEAKRWETHGLTARGLPRKQGPARVGQSYTSLREASE